MTIETIMRCPAYFGNTSWVYAAKWITDFSNNEPNLIALVQDAGVHEAILDVLEREVRNVTLPSAHATFVHCIAHVSPFSLPGACASSTLTHTFSLPGAAVGRDPSGDPESPRRHVPQRSRARHAPRTQASLVSQARVLIPCVSDFASSPLFCGLFLHISSQDKV
jgi:hypothetical protein